MQIGVQRGYENFKRGENFFSEVRNPLKNSWIRPWSIIDKTSLLTQRQTCTFNVTMKSTSLPICFDVSGKSPRINNVSKTLPFYIGTQLKHIWALSKSWTLFITILKHYLYLEACSASCLLPERIRLLRVVPGSLDDYGHDDVIIIDEKKELLLASRKRSRQSKNESLNLFLRKKHFF